MYLILINYTIYHAYALVVWRLPQLKKCCARAGLSPIGSNDELLSSLVDHLVENAFLPPDATSSAAGEDSATDNSSSASSSSSGVEKPSGVAIAKKILSLDESDDYEGILNLLGGDGGGRITKSSPVAVMRKAYLKLSLQIHPDKLSRVFDQATKAFQVRWPPCDMLLHDVLFA
jgi:hypothetical protein